MLSNTSQVDCLEKFRKAVVENFKLDIDHLMNQKYSKEEKTKIEYENE